MTAPSLMAAATDPIVPSGSNAQLILAAIGGIAVIVLLITWLKLHAFLALMIGAIGVGIAAGLGAIPSVDAFAKGFGDTMGGVGILIGLGAMYGKLLADSGGADRIVDTLVNRSSVKALPWMMALVGALIGLPMFFEVGLVLLMPVIILVARRSGQPLMRIAIPTLAGLSAMHGLVPPHPGPLVAISALGANLGLTLAQRPPTIGAVRTRSGPSRPSRIICFASRPAPLQTWRNTASSCCRNPSTAQSARRLSTEPGSPTKAARANRLFRKPIANMSFASRKECCTRCSGTRASPAL